MKRKQLIPETTEKSAKSIEKKESDAKKDSPPTPKVDNTEVSFIVEPSRRKTVKKAKIFIEGKLTIYNADFIAKRIKELFLDYDIVDFKLQNIEEFHLSVIQIFYYLREFFMKEGKTITIQALDLTKETKQLLAKTKYDSILFKTATT